jgi:hypothetical protein
MLALKLSRLIEEKCMLLEKFSLVQKQHDDLVSSLKDGEKFYRKLMVELIPSETQGRTFPKQKKR